MAFAEAGVVFVARGVDKFIRTMKNMNQSVDNFNDRIGKSVSAANRLQTQVDNVALGAAKAITAAVAAATLVAGIIVTTGVDIATSFESAFADVTKTVDALIDRSETAAQGVITLTEEGTKFREELVALSGEIPVAFEELSRIAGLGGQLGVVEGLAGDEAREALLRFTETVAGLAEATNLTQEKAATGLAQISNIFRETVDDIGLNVEQLGSTIVELGNTSAATESLILNFSQRIAGAGQTVGLTQADVLGIGTAFASIGITAEAGSTAVNRALLIMNEAVSNSTGKFLDNTTAINTTIEEISDLQADLVRLEAQTGITGESLTAQREAFLEAGGAAEDFGRQLGDARREQLFKTQTEIDRLIQKLNQLRTTQGTAITTEVFDELFRVIQNTAQGAELTAETFRDMFRDDPAEAFTLFVEGLAEEGEGAGETLDKIGLGSVEATRAFLAMSGASGLVRDRILAANEAFLANQALTDEVSVRYATLKSNVEELINVIRGVTDSLFSPIIGPLNSIVDWGKEVVLVLGEEIPETLTALSNKFGPEFKKVFEEIFGPQGLFAGGQITTPEGFVLSGEAIGVEPSSITNLRNAFDNLQESINALDISGFSDKVISVRDTIVPIWTGAMEFFREHADIATGAVKGLAIVLGGTVLAAAVTKAVSVLGLVLTPLGQISLAVIGLSIAWETNFLGIQGVTERVVGSIKSSLDSLIETVRGFDLGGLFEGTTLTPEMGDVEGQINVSLLNRLSQVGEVLMESLGEAITFFGTSLLDKVEAVLGVFQGIQQVIQGINDDTLNLAKTLGGIETIIDSVIEGLTSDLVNFLEIFGINVDMGPIKEFAFDVAREFIEGFLTGLGIGDLELGDSFQGLVDSLVGFAESGGIQVFLAGLKQIGEGLSELWTSIGNLVTALGGLTGLEFGDVVNFLGLVTGFLVGTTLDQIVGVVDALTGLVVVLTGLANLDLGQMGEGLALVGEGLLSIVSAPFENLFNLFSEDAQLQIAQGALDILAAFQEGMNEGFISMDLGESIAQWIMNLNNQMVTGINLVIDNIRNAFTTNDPLDLDVEATSWIDDISDSLFNFFTNTDILMTGWIDSLSDSLFNFFANTDTLMTGWIDRISDSLFGFFVRADQAFTVWINDVSDRLFGFVSGIWEGVDIGVPSFQGILDRAKQVVDTLKAWFTGLFDGIELPTFDFGILDKLAELGIIDIETPDTAGLGDDLTSGIIGEVEDAEETWRDAWLDFLLSPIEEGAEALGIKSPSTVTKAMAEDVILGYAEGLSNLTPIEESLIGVNTSILSAFQALSTEWMGRTVPTMGQVDRVFQAFYTDTLPRTTSALVDELIPAKRELTEVNLNELIPSVDDLILVEETLETTFQNVKDALDPLIASKEKDVLRSKELVKQVDRLAESYLALAAAIGSASQAGDGLTAPTPTTAPGTPFQEGGSFIVPQNVGAMGMPIRVHAGELVQIIPAKLTQKMQSIPVDVMASTVKSPAISGATFNSVSNVSNSSSEVKEYHLHVQEAPSSDPRDGFELMEALS